MGAMRRIEWCLEECLVLFGYHTRHSNALSEITERLRDPRGLRRGGLSATAAVFPRNLSANGAPPRGFVRFFFTADRNNAEDQPPAKRRLLSAVAKEDGEIDEDSAMNQDPRLVSRNKRMLGQLKFRKEDMKISVKEAFIQRSNASQRHKKNKKRQREHEQIAEQRRRDLFYQFYYVGSTQNFSFFCINQTLKYQFFCNLGSDHTIKHPLSYVEKELGRWQSARKASYDVNLQETITKNWTLMGNGPRTRKIPGGSNNERDDDAKGIIL
ncbi:protein-protein interaction regulator [Salix suchowensis]|nr:protein-protein interaction regulator [Salix suchowensis]